MKLKSKALLFDMDGVLIDSLDTWWQAVNSAFKITYNREITRQEFIEKYWGHDLRDILEKEKLNPEVAEVCNFYYPKFIDLTLIYPDTISTLKKLNKFKKALITNTPRICTKQVLKKYDLEEYFDTILTCNDVPRAKPHPEIVFKACKNLNINPKEAILIGDTKSDIIAGKAAGCTIIGFNIKADYTISKISELLNILE